MYYGLWAFLNACINLFTANMLCPKRNFKMVYWFLFMIAMVFSDQLTKWLAVIKLKGEGSFPLWEGVFHFTYPGILW